MKKFSIDIKKDYAGLNTNRDISFDSRIVELFNEYSSDGEFECKSILITNNDNGITVNISCNCSYNNDAYIFVITNKIVTLVEVHLSQAILITCGNQIRERASVIKLFDEPRITKIEVVDEGEFNKINNVVGSCFGHFGYLRSELVKLDTSGLESNLISSCNLMKKAHSKKKELINQSILYLTMVENQGEESGLVPQDFIQKFFFTWSAFNSIYQIYEPDVDKKGVEGYAIKSHVVDYFRLNYLNIKQYLNRLSDKNLIDKKGNNCSNELKNAIAIESFENISLWTFLCIYLIRNTVFHGKIEGNDELGLCRIATIILLPIVHISVLEEIKIL